MSLDRNRNSDIGKSGLGYRNMELPDVFEKLPNILNGDISGQILCSLRSPGYAAAAESGSG
ncbi:MAG: hypothetical protein HQK54_00630 [Oligoflexales bacterium]|nr:hypothetical protein [Oligoflexales bacterium]